MTIKGHCDFCFFTADFVPQPPPLPSNSCPVQPRAESWAGYVWGHLNAELWAGLGSRWRSGAWLVPLSASLRSMYLPVLCPQAPRRMLGNWLSVWYGARPPLYTGNRECVCRDHVRPLGNVMATPANTNPAPPVLGVAAFKAPSARPGSSCWGRRRTPACPAGSPGSAHRF